MKKPIVFLDFETTGVDVANSRIVQIASVKFLEDFKQEGDFKNMLINPGFKIPADATAVHNITDEMVKDKPQFLNISKGFRDYLAGCNIAGHNILRFDVPLLAEEFARCGIIWPEPGTLFFDTFSIMANKVQRTLAGAYLYYTGEEMKDTAHDAYNDTKATVEIFRAQMEAYPDLKEMKEEELFQFCKGDKTVDLAGCIALNDKGEAIYNFGKDKGKVIHKNTGYAKWMQGQSFTSETKRLLDKITKATTSIFADIDKPLP